MPIEGTCTPIDYRRITRWAREAILEAMQRWLDRKTGTYRHRDELARPCLQPQATDQFAWHGEDDQSNEVAGRLNADLTACGSRSTSRDHRREAVARRNRRRQTTAFPTASARSRRSSNVLEAVVHAARCRLRLVTACWEPITKV